MRRTTTLTALLLGATLLAPTGSANAVGETCRGEAATIVGKGGTVIRGTAGRDVIVTNNSIGVFSRGGDDLVCVTGRATGAGESVVTIGTSDGNDVVDATLAARGWSVALNLGAGADEFAGGVGGDIVVSGPTGETDVDILRGGDGSDQLITRGGADVLYGDRSTDYFMVPDATDALLDGGEGQDEISIDMDQGGWVVDLATGATRNDVRTHSWSSIETLNASGDIGHLVVEGTSGPDEVNVLPRRSARPLLDIRTGGGADSFLLFGSIEDTSGINLGAGRDEVRLDHDGDLSLYLRSGVLVMGGVADVSGVEDATAYGRKTVLIGTTGRNRLRAGQCTTQIRGLGGADDISYSRSNAIGIHCESGRATELIGGASNDSIEGSRFPDSIDGGPGRDAVDGGRGRDTCTSAERRTSCEVSR